MEVTWTQVAAPAAPMDPDLDSCPYTFQNSSTETFIGGYLGFANKSQLVRFVTSRECIRLGKFHTLTKCKQGYGGYTKKVQAEIINWILVNRSDTSAVPRTIEEAWDIFAVSPMEKEEFITFEGCLVYLGDKELRLAAGKDISEEEAGEEDTEPATLGDDVYDT